MITSWNIILTIIIVCLSIIMPIYYYYQRKKNLKHEVKTLEDNQIKEYIQGINQETRNRNK